MSAFASASIVDAHQHLNSAAGIDRLLAKGRQFGYEAVNIVVIDLNEKGAARNAAALLAKKAAPGRVYAFGGFQYRLGVDSPAAADVLTQAKMLRSAGCDGIKLIEGKPTVRKDVGLPLDSPNLMAFYEWAQSAGVPVLAHVGDPEEFWDEARCPKWAKDAGWLYDGSYAGLDQLRDEMLRVLKAFPRLKVMLAHFFFLSTQLDRARRIMDENPGITLDLTPGTEQYPHFSEDVPGWRRFFIDYQDRIVYGTDLFDRDGEEDHGRMEMVRRFLEWDRPFDYYKLHCHGLGLPADVLAKIYAGNFRRLVGERPRPISADEAHAFCDGRAALAVRIADDEVRQRVLAELASASRKLHGA